jgi:hypothetical protein
MLVLRRTDCDSSLVVAKAQPVRLIAPAKSRSRSPVQKDGTSHRYVFGREWVCTLKPPE